MQILPDLSHAKRKILHTMEAPRRGVQAPAVPAVPAATSTTDTFTDFDETMSDRYEGSDINEDTQQDEDVDDDEQSEYSYHDSDDEDDGECYNAAPAPAKAAATAPPVAVATLAAKPKPKGIDPLAELDSILASLNEVFPEAINTEDQAFLSLVTHQQDAKLSSEQQPPDNKKSRHGTPPKAKSTANTTTRTTEAAPQPAVSPKTSTLKAGVGYETGNYTQSSSVLKKEILSAVKKQQELDGRCNTLMKRLLQFLKDYKGSEGVVLLTFKMSPGFNRLLFSLLKNDSLLEWGKRRAVYDTALDVLSIICESQFYAGFLLHNLLEGDGSPGDGTSDCQTLLEILDVKSEIMKRSQETVLAGASASTSTESALARDTIEICEKVISTYAKVNEAIKNGREVGTIVNPSLELAGRCMIEDSDSEGDDKPPPTEAEEIATYLKGMKKHRLEHVALIKAVNTGKTDHKYVSSVTSKTTSASSVKPRRMLRIASEIAGLSADLPIEWASGIFVRVDEDRPDLLKACIMAPEGTPYESGCFEFDISLPLTYPESPPQVHLVTTDRNGVRFNPNLYNNGKVCLSLLGTWQGPGWITETSTLLQVLVSIQSLILVPDPYFNEPGYDAASGDQQEKSKMYDRQVRAATLKVAILGQMKKPSRLFADCIKDHFRLKKRRILKQLEEWEELEKNEEASSAGTTYAASTSLVAGGGCVHSATIVKGFCDEIRSYMDEEWPDKKKNKKSIEADDE